MSCVERQDSSLLGTGKESCLTCLQFQAMCFFWPGSAKKTGALHAILLQTDVYEGSKFRGWVGNSLVKGLIMHYELLDRATMRRLQEDLEKNKLNLAGPSTEVRPFVPVSFN